jgi:hypothetical protein
MFVLLGLEAWRLVPNGRNGISAQMSVNGKGCIVHEPRRVTLSPLPSPLIGK